MTDRLRFTMTTTLRVPHERITEAHEWLNTHHTGLPEAPPLGAYAPRPLVDASYALHMAQIVQVEVELQPDGRLRILRFLP